jgi:hypothetical protein
MLARVEAGTVRFDPDQFCSESIPSTAHMRRCCAFQRLPPRRTQSLPGWKSQRCSAPFMKIFVFPNFRFVPSERNNRLTDDLIDHLFNNSEQRLARILLLRQTLKRMIGKTCLLGTSIKTR